MERKQPGGIYRNWVEATYSGLRVERKQPNGIGIGRQQPKVEQEQRKSSVVK